MNVAEAIGAVAAGIGVLGSVAVGINFINRLLIGSIVAGAVKKEMQVARDESRESIAEIKQQLNEQGKQAQAFREEQLIMHGDVRMLVEASKDDKERHAKTEARLDAKRARLDNHEQRISRLEAWKDTQGNK